MAACAINDHDDVVKTRYERARIEQKTLEQEEGARLLYVALTRAREEVYVACSQASFVAQSSVPNLVGLFLQAYKKVPEEFLLYCDIDQLSMPSRSMQKCTSLLVQDNFAPVATPPKMQRWFASALRMGKDYGITSLIKKPRASIFRKVDGDGAHRLLAWICPLLRQDLSHDTLDYLVDAAMRSEGLCASVDTISAVKTTALALMARLDQHTRLISELPLSFMARPEIMIEGFADLVVIDNDFVGVIEFKSSFMSAVSENSYGQVLAYAEALAQYTAKRVRYAVVLVGSSPWEWQEYDDEARTVFYRSISMV
jgi:ATP-dependent exoDNAse (exonuclease V) beta subunit